MDTFGPGPTASHEMADRMSILRRRIEGYDREQVRNAELALKSARDELALDQRLLAEWQDIANRSA